MRATYRVTPLLAWAFSLVVLAASATLLAWFAKETVQHVTADDQPAVVTDVSGTASRSMTGRQRDGRTISFQLEDGSEHSASARSRWLWRPSDGDTVHVHETSPGDWEITEEFSWPRTLGFSALLLLPWVVALLKAWEWAEKTWRPERWEAKERASRQEARKRRAARRESSS